mmetsp:Transcript_33167/g.91403  ORF Transcript_33167/g.91403 Transcript_33167/m.91403 type:complete len:217 (-) Transcript_33167:661-1311(-)
MKSSIAMAGPRDFSWYFGKGDRRVAGNWANGDVINQGFCVICLSTLSGALGGGETSGSLRHRSAGKWAASNKAWKPPGLIIKFLKPIMSFGGPSSSTSADVAKGKSCRHGGVPTCHSKDTCNGCRASQFSNTGHSSSSVPSSQSMYKSPNKGPDSCSSQQGMRSSEQVRSSRLLYAFQLLKPSQSLVSFQSLFGLQLLFSFQPLCSSAQRLRSAQV